MFQLTYRVDLEVAAFLFAILIYVETCVHYPKKTRKNQLFRRLAQMVLLTDAFDLATAVTNTYAASIPQVVNMLVNSGYFMSGLLLCYLLHLYIEQAIVPPGGRSVLLRFNKYVLIALELSMLPNLLLGFYFSFPPAGIYTHGPLYLVLHVASLWFVLCGSAALIVNRRLLTCSQIASSFLFIGLYFAAVYLQTFVLPDVLLIMPTVTAMLIITTFQLESPDYLQLQQTLQELTQTKQELERVNAQYYELACTDRMTGLHNRSAYNLRLETIEADPPEDLFILMADINSLKHLNDCHGHLVGDEAITRAAGLLLETFPAPCECYRVGGDEFVVLAPGLTEEAFYADHQRFLQSVAEAAHHLAYPFSVATGCVSRDARSVSEALRLADERMYADKQQTKGKR